ncbi:F-box protein-like protein, partial [Tanacetum coccineum]
MIYDMNPDSRTKLIRRCYGLHPAVYSVISNDDILIEISVRLPIISLLTVKQVSKHWLNLIQEPNFTLLLSQRPKIDPASALYIKRSPFHDFGSDLFSFRMSRFWPANFRLGEGSNGFEIMQSCNGLLLCSVGEKPRRKRYVCNPTIRMFKRLYKCQYESLRILFDPRKSLGYKVFHAQKKSDDFCTTRLQVFCSEKDDWSDCAEVYPVGLFVG